MAENDDNALRNLMSESGLADRWGKSRRTLQRYRYDGAGPAWIRIGGKIMYWTEDVEAFEAANRYGGEAGE